MARATVPTADLSPLAALRAFRRDPLGLLERVAELGDVVRIRIPRGDAYLLNHPDLVHDVLIGDHKAFRKGPTIEASKMLLGDSLLTSEGEHHLRQRRLIQPMFHHERIATYGEAMVRHAERVAGTWRAGAEIDVRAEMASLTLAIVGETLFGTDVDDRRSATVTRALTQTLSMFDRVYSPVFRLLVHLPTPTMRRYRRVEAELNDVIETMIRERRASGSDGGRDDVLSLLLRATEDGIGMTDREVRDEALTLFLAGHETTANALAWTWWLLAQHPGAEARFHAELHSALDGGVPTVADLPRLGYARAVLSESIRLRPPAWAIGRRVVREHLAGGVAIAPGSVVVVSPWLLHHDPRWWRDPDDFRPERWLEPHDRLRFAFAPFGGGPRVCIGEAFAWMEGTLLLATIASRWRLRLVPGHVVEPQAVVTLRPRNGIPMVPEHHGASSSSGDRTLRMAPSGSKEPPPAS